MHAYRQRSPRAYGMGLTLKPCRVAATHSVVASVSAGGTSTEVSAEAPAQAGSSNEEEAAAPAGSGRASKAQRSRRSSDAGTPQGQSISAPATLSGAFAQAQEAPGVAKRLRYCYNVESLCCCPGSGCSCCAEHALSKPVTQGSVCAGNVLIINQIIRSTACCRRHG